MGKDPTSRTLLGLLGLAVFIWALYLVRDSLPPFLIAFGLAILLDPILDRMQKRGWRRGWAVAVTFVLFLAAFVGSIAILLPLSINQVNQLVSHIPSAYEQVRTSIDKWALANITVLEQIHFPTSTKDVWDRYHREIAAYLQGLPMRIFGAFESSAGRLIWIVIIPMVTLYMMIDIDKIRRRIVYLIPKEYEAHVLDVVRDVSTVFARYVRGLFVVCTGFGIALGILLGVMFRLPYALILAPVGAVLYAVPYIGPLATIAIAAMVAWGSSQNLAYTVGTGVAVLILNQIFDQIITPRVLGKAVGLHPIASIFALMVGGTLFGLVGMILAVPLGASVQVVLKKLYPPLGHELPPEGSEDSVEPAVPLESGDGGGSPITRTSVSSQTPNRS